MKRTIAFLIVSAHLVFAQGQQNGVGELSHPTVDELHQKLNELVQRFTAEEAEKERNAEKARKSTGQTAEAPAKTKNPAVFAIVLERGGKRTAGDKDNPVVFEEIIMSLQNGNVTAIELKYEEAALRRQFFHKRSIKNDDIKKSNLGHISLLYQAEGDLAKSDILVNMSTADRAKLIAIYIDGLLRAIRDLDDRVLAARKLSNKKMNRALNMGVTIR